MILPAYLMNGNRHGQIPLLAHRALLLQPTESTKPDTGPSAEKEIISYFIVKHLQVITQSLYVREMKMPRVMNAIDIESQVLLNLFSLKSLFYVTLKSALTT